MASNTKIKELLNQQFSDSRLADMYKIFDEWTLVAYEQTNKAREKFSIGQLRGKLSEEYSESKRAMEFYSRSLAKDKRLPYALEENGDVINMAQILMPLFYISPPEPGNLPDLRMMIGSLAYHHPIYGMDFLFPFDVSHEYKREELFSTWVKETTSINLRFRQMFPDDSRCIATTKKVEQNMQFILNQLDELSEQNNFEDLKHLGVNMRIKGVMLLGDVITNMMYQTGELDGVQYEDLFRVATEKMRKRDKRYHGAQRLD